MNIGVIGGGSWGTALAILLSNNNHSVDIWVRDKRQMEEMRQHKENYKYLPGVTMTESISVTDDIAKAIFSKDLLVLSIPSHGVREVLKNNKKLFRKDQVIVNVAKGIENDTLLRISEIVDEILPNNPYAVLSGPSHAEEVARNMPTTVVSASIDKKVAEYVQDIFMSPFFRVYTNPDVIGVELGGSLKNVIALGAGISDGLEYGDNTKAALMTRGITEIARLGEKMGANSATFSGLAGIGDLIVTCTSMHSRNRRAGILIGQGKTIKEATESVGMVVEGIRTTKSTYELSKKHHVVMPITNELYEVLYEGKDVKNSVVNLMLRDKKHEMEDVIRDQIKNW
ncbi:NAD(P)H-dependent glycerol-3-phosphate dehydrogenase [[Clostridium] ultunense Esp]|uniref:Glycerol-3-phosphate dehydrogenase [NAD(P)+] n=1 Tax=[Clostridium] ultunense Esp TaxID=1288971 RepID=M1ZCX5_9FIRM|nr:NAD(P)H-dependent glycerol-3-phosphate dehydrogenase [Schnuerera ultunensis]CCQ96024.1 NAD(P)H-dependent glycerol-3-phosphate dehydrogenase [[Clostridium] ultunense Esp]SHD76916.1 NAD(P)H-dependent glycerol-3-phosphate dehydrogenase [[Clostridium] ultunense Esp]